MAAVTGSGDGGQHDLSSTTAELSCQECRRRKARCDRSIPSCGLCNQYRRPCLYEKHSRTPLTRKHLTEVEERLERAEALIKRLKRDDSDSGHPTQSPRYAPTAASVATDDVSRFGSCEVGPGSVTISGHGDAPAPSTRSSSVLAAAPTPRAPDTSTTATLHHATSLSFSYPPPRTAHGRLDQGQPEADLARNLPSKSLNTLSLAETPPQDDFEWDEQDSPRRVDDESLTGFPAAADSDPELVVPDGMASLPVSVKEAAGYLGVASGAALLRIIEPKRASARRDSRSRPRRRSSSTVLAAAAAAAAATIPAAPDPNRQITDAMIDAYFRRYHLSYPIVHEATFRAQYSEVIPQPNGKCWQILAYTVAAIGVYSSPDAPSNNLDLDLFAHARSMLSFDHLELGNITLVQALTLISNYQQKRDKPNSGYNYLGLAVRMATGLGLHKEFGWKISPLQMEIRRRAWWSLCVFDVGATITFSRPTVWPYEGVEVAFPLNVTDRDLTANTKTYPKERDTVTPYTAVGVQARFHVATNRIYSRVISKPFAPADELLRMEAELLAPWLAGVPPCFGEDAAVPPQYSLAHAVMQWRYRNFRIIMYRPFVIRRALAGRNNNTAGGAGGGGSSSSFSEADARAYAQCLEDAAVTIRSISRYWSTSEHNRLAAWYALYFLFQAALIPCICLRNSPLSPEAPSWCDQVATTLRTIRALAPLNTSCDSCYEVIVDLCGRYLDLDRAAAAAAAAAAPQPPPAVTAAPQQQQLLGPIDDSPQTQINQVFPMMWPNVNALEAAGEVLGSDAWLSFLDGDGMGGGGGGGGGGGAYASY